MTTTRTILVLCGAAALVLALTLTLTPAWWAPHTPPPSTSPEAPAASNEPVRRPAPLTPAQKELVDAMAGTPRDQRQGFMILPVALADLNRVSLRSVFDGLQQKAQAGDAVALRRLSDIGSACKNELYGEKRRQEFHLSRPVSPGLAPCQELTAEEIAGYADNLYAAARAGDREARLRLHMNVEHVRGDAARKQQARDDTLEWLRVLARDGDPEAMMELAHVAMGGDLRQPRDFVYAYACYLQALPRLHSSNERKGADYAMNLLRERLTAADIARAQARAASTAPFD